MALHEHPPRGLLRFAFRVPLGLYRLGLGWLLDSRFLLLRHRGRKSGAIHDVVLEVVHRDRDRSTYYVAAAWGERAQWFQNIQADARVSVLVGRTHFDGVALPLDEAESRRLLETYRRKHGIAMKGLQRVLGYASFDDLVAATPIVEIRPTS